MELRRPVARNAAGATVYRDRVVTAVMWGYAITTFVIFASLTAAAIAPALRAGAALLAITDLLVTRFQWSRVGLEFRPDGIRLWGMLTRRFIPLSQIRVFTATQETFPKVRAELTTGEVLRTGLTQGRKMYWREGASKDIVTVLNTALDTARRTGV
jgi:hypothetical protein